MRPLLAELKRRLGATSPTVLLGILLLVSGIVSWFVAPSGEGDTSATSALTRGISGALRLAQRVVVWGDERVEAGLPRLNAVLVGVFLDQVPASQRESMERYARFSLDFVGDLASPLALVSLAGLTVGYFALSRWIDRRLDELRPAAQAPEEPPGSQPASR